MKIDIIKAGTAAALLLGSQLAFGHSAEEGAVEAGSAGYINGANQIIATGDGCLRSSEFSEENQENVCEGIEEEAAEEPAAETETTTEAETAPAEPTIVPIARSVKADFASGSDVPTPEGEAAIAALISELSQLQEIVTIDIAGHSDSRGSAALNQSLSEKRAAAVRDRLATAFPGAAITSAGFGETQPIESNDTPEGRAANRRVDVNVTAKSVQN